MAMAEDLLGRSIMATMMCDQVISPKFETLALGVAINHSRVRCSSTPSSLSQHLTVLAFFSWGF